MRLLIVFIIFFNFINISYAYENKSFPKTYTINNLSISIKKDGSVNLMFKNSKVLAVRNIWFMDKKWAKLARKTGDKLTVNVLKQNESEVLLCLKDKRQHFLKNFVQIIKLTREGLWISVDYEYSADIGQWHWPIYLFAEHYSGKKYKSLLKNGITKQGFISKDIPEKVIYKLDNNSNIKELNFDLNKLDLKFSFTEGGWYLCDHRKIWKALLLLNSSSSKKKNTQEHYAVKISLKSKME